MRCQPSWWWEIFFEVLQATGNVSKAAAASGRRRAEVYEIRDLNPEFLVLWDEALLAYNLVREEKALEEKRRRMARARFHLLVDARTRAV